MLKTPSGAPLENNATRKNLHLEHRSPLSSLRNTFYVAIFTAAAGCTANFEPSGRFIENRSPISDHDISSDNGIQDAAGPIDVMETRDVDEVTPNDSSRDAANYDVSTTDSGCEIQDDDQPCTTESCDPSTGITIHIPKDIDDDIACTEDACDPETGEIIHNPVNLDCEPVICQTVVCDSNEGCVSTPVANGEECDSAPVIHEECRDGLCVSECINDTDCDDNKECTTEICNQAEGFCEYRMVDDFCDDGNFCNGQESCNPNRPLADEATGCLDAEEIPVCPDDGKSCTRELCNPAPEINGCVSEPLDNRCDDGNICTGREMCNPALGDAESGCTNPPDTDCSFQNVLCQVGTCVPETGMCELRASQNDIPCSHGEFCIVGKTCQGGMCVGGSPRDCNDNDLCTPDECDEANDQCINAPIDCSRLNEACKDASCNPLTGECEVQNKPDGTLCPDNLFCSINETCENGICLTETVQCLDDNRCNGQEFCDEGRDSCVDGPPLHCAGDITMGCPGLNRFARIRIIDNEDIITRYDDDCGQNESRNINIAVREGERVVVCSSRAENPPSPITILNIVGDTRRLSIKGRALQMTPCTENIGIDVTPRLTEGGRLPQEIPPIAPGRYEIEANPQTAEMGVFLIGYVR